ncbi:MAG: hypothetical protein ACRDHW_21810, partial [Ktedonobacteraceae bacterium]
AQWCIQLRYTFQKLRWPAQPGMEENTRFSEILPRNREKEAYLPSAFTNRMRASQLSKFNG